MTAIAVDPYSPQVLYAGTNSEGIFKSSDGGTTWLHTAGQLSKGTVWTLLHDPTKASTIYATTHDGLFRSEDSGVTWKGLHKSLKSWNVLALAIDPESPKTLYAATAIGIYKSLDAGGSWAMQNNDLYVSALSLDPRATSVALRRNASRRAEERGRRREVGAAAARAGPQRPVPPPGRRLGSFRRATCPSFRWSGRNSPVDAPALPALCRSGPACGPTPQAQRRLSIGDE